MPGTTSESDPVRHIWWAECRSESTGSLGWGQGLGGQRDAVLQSAEHGVEGVDVARAGELDDPLRREPRSDDGAGEQIDVEVGRVEAEAAGDLRGDLGDAQS